MSETEPLAYTLGWIPFIHTEIYLDSRPLIPRTETEYWVNQAIQEVKKSEIKEPRILDLCAGSGCIGVAVLKEIPEAFVDFVEIEESHHKTIGKNIRENKLDSSRTRIFGGDLFEQVHDSYDFILSNPPYIDPELQHRVQKSVMLYEPRKALYGGKEGMEIIKEIISKAGAYLNDKGILFIEHEPEQVKNFSQHPMYLSSHKDQFGIIRFSQFYKSNGNFQQ
ncbi:MAG: HemK family protein methyltransferase [Candidatus Zambryskibacteria bacterium]|nr:HemK family protein methyltransferase [Candidatus Zambryskibacteria bacterium]